MPRRSPWPVAAPAPFLSYSSIVLFPFPRRATPWVLVLALLCLGAGKDLNGDDLLAEPQRAQLTYVAGWLDGYLQALDGVNDRAQLAMWRRCLLGHGIQEMRVRVVYYYSRHPDVRKLRLQLTMLDALLEACEQPPRFRP